MTEQTSQPEPPDLIREVLNAGCGHEEVRVFRGDRLAVCILCEQSLTKVWVAAEANHRLAEADRNARAHGYEIGKGVPLTAGEINTSDDNPFVDPLWREHLLGQGDDGVPLGYTLADYRENGHIDGCRKNTHGAGYPCDLDCAGILYELARNGQEQHG